MHLMVKAYLGIKSTGKGSPVPQNNPGDLLGMLGQGGVNENTGGPLAALIAPYLDKGKDHGG
jgi:hypothetical protein